jgi:Lysozyme like domain
MATSIGSAIAAAQQAGFSGQSLITIVSIAMAESGLNPGAQHVNSDGSLDRGILQINSRWHPEVSNACAYNVTCAFQAGYTISSRGTNFNPWTTYKTGAYSSNVASVQSAAGGVQNAVSSISNPLAGNCGLFDVQCQLMNWGEHIAIFVLALLIVVVGLLLLGMHQKVGA